MFKTINKLISSAIITCCIANTAQALDFSAISQVYFFGDSLTDSGFNNLFPVPPGKAQTFTTYGGFVWAQYVAHDIKGYPLSNVVTNNTTPLIPGPWPVDPILTGIDYACGGSTTDSFGYSPSPPGPFFWAPSLEDQVTHFLNTQPLPLDPDALYFIWSGANDFFVTLSGPTNQLALLETAQHAAFEIAEQVKTLSKHGARRVVVMSLPNLGITPEFQAAGQVDPSIPGELKTVTFTFNSLLNQYLGQVIKTNPVKVLYIDTYDLLDQVIQDTAAGRPYVINGTPFYFTNYTDPACGNVSAIECPPGTPPGYIFADGVHPTDEAHKLLSVYVEDKIASWS